MNRDESPSSTTADTQNLPWYAGVTGYQWFVLIVASLGWVFDVFEGQIFVASMNEAMPQLVPEGTEAAQVDAYNKLTFGAFLVGGALGGVLFGVLSDRIGRRRTLSYTILMYSAFTCLSALAESWWHMAALRFLVAMGVGGEWAVASALVAEVMPARARAWSLSIFHASSVFGTYLAIAAGVFVVGNANLGWRWGFVLGAVPAVLILLIRWRLKEPESWQRARADAAQRKTRSADNLVALFRGHLLRHTLVGVSLATVGLATFWGVHVYGKDMLGEHRVEELKQAPKYAGMSGTEIEFRAADKKSIKNWEMLGMFLVTTGGGIGLVSFGPLSEMLGRRGAFLVFHLGGLAGGAGLFALDPSVSAVVLYCALPVFGFFTLGMHAGYAVYFPELFPTWLRGTGAGFCFNMARLAAAGIMVLVARAQDSLELSAQDAALYLSALFLVGVLLLPFAPETKGKELPE